jgi:hypothetical protein
MNQRKTFSITLCLMACSCLTFGQEYAFKVLVNKGKNEVKSGANWAPVKVGASLKSPDELKVSENSYVGLIHASGKPMEVKSAGKYKIADLSAKVGSGSSVLNKYTDFILSSNSAEARKNRLSATGSVTRGIGKIKVYLPPSSSYVYGDTVTIEWEKDKTIAAPFVVTFNNIFGDELYKVETNEHNVTVNLQDKSFAAENDVIVKVYSKKDKKDSDEHTLRKFSRGDKDKITTSYSEVASQTSANTGFNKFIRAGYFEQNKLLADAVTAFQQALKLEPAFKEEYDFFLLRTGLRDLPKK